MNFWETLLHPDQEERDDAERQEVGRVANILQVGEFQVLQLAYREWHDDDLPEAMMDRLFHDYMMHNDVPYWARHYARQILRLEDAGRLDENRPQYHLYDSAFDGHVPKGARRLWVITGCIAILFVMVAVLSEYSPGKAVSPFPPFFSEQELRPSQQD